MCYLFKDTNVQLYRHMNRHPYAFVLFCTNSAIQSLSQDSKTIHYVFFKTLSLVCKNKLFSSLPAKRDINLPFNNITA